MLSLAGIRDLRCCECIAPLIVFILIPCKSGRAMTEDRQQRRLAPIFAADVFGYSRLSAENEEETLRTLKAHRAVIDRPIARHEGRIFNTAGDSVLAEFSSAVEAVRCA